MSLNATRWCLGHSPTCPPKRRNSESLNETASCPVSCRCTADAAASTDGLRTYLELDLAGGCEDTVVSAMPTETTSHVQSTQSRMKASPCLSRCSFRIALGWSLEAPHLVRHRCVHVDARCGCARA